jgi:two-component system, cell cycle response regulator DivK
MAAPGGSVGGPESPLVLVVEDDPETRHFYTLTLAANGFRTEEAHNGFQALDKATAIIPDLILSGIAVRGIDGIELCRRLRAEPRTTRIPILAVTGDDDRHYPDRAMAAGANQVLIKPFAAETLLGEARSLLASRKIRDRSIA